MSPRRPPGTTAATIINHNHNNHQPHHCHNVVYTSVPMDGMGATTAAAVDGTTASTASANANLHHSNRRNVMGPTTGTSVAHNGGAIPTDENVPLCAKHHHQNLALYEARKLYESLQF